MTNETSPQSGQNISTISIPDFKCSRSLQYQPLIGPDSIRVVKLWPEAESQHIKCSLHHIELDATDFSYHALSYTWGNWTDVESRRSIECDGAEVVISANLHFALSRLRDRENPLFLWIDALCINQAIDHSALKEREQQVSMMHQIFSRADSAFVDLGDAGEAEEMLVEILRPCAEKAQIVIEFDLPCHLSKLREIGDLPELDHPFWITLAQLCERKYFRRLWVLQEYSTAQRVTILIGHSRLGSCFMDSLLFASFYFQQLIGNFIVEINLDATLPDQPSKLDLMNKLWPWLMTIWGTAFNLCRFVKTRRDRMSDRVYDHGLSQGLLSSPIFDVTEFRDRVYAVLGLSKKCILPNSAYFHVDYTEPMEQLSERLAIHLIEHENASFVLARCTQIPSIGPSWAFRFDKLEVEPLEYLVEPRGMSKEFQANGSTTLSVQVMRPERLLRSKALLLGNITTLSDAYFRVKPFLSLDYNVLIGMTKWLLDLSKWVESIRLSDPTKRSLSNCYRAVFMDCHSSAFGLRVNRTHKIPHFEQLLQTVIDHTSYLRQVQEENPSMWNLEYIELERYLFRSNQFPVMLFGSKHLRMALLGENRFCAVPGACLLGDQVAIICGMPIPILLRPQKNNTFAIVGLCYVQDMMDGQAFEDPSRQVEEIFLC